MGKKANHDLSIHSHDSSLLLAEFSSLVNAFQGVAGEYLSSEVLSKYLSVDTDSAAVRRQRAISKWLSVEEQNAVTNERLWNHEAKFSFGFSTALIRKASQLIVSTIGQDPPPDVLYGSFSNGASTSKRLAPGVIARKFQEQADVTRRCWKRVKEVILTCETWRLHSDDFGMTPNFVRGNVMFTVPKTSIIDRVACKEPDLNMFAQRGVGDHIRGCLRRKGIDLNNQAINRELAREGSRTGELATIDLSSASDTVSTSLVAMLLPSSWFELLDDLRCEETCIDDHWHKNEMFSSMGNGFTFELESLIFWALSKATAYMTGSKGRISVYGDDIIVPSGLAPRLYHVLEYFGFKVNQKKSFYKGSFRESCGGHYDGGRDVTPFYIKEPVTHVSQLIHLLNKLRAWSIRTSYDYHEPAIFAFWQKWSSLVPSALWGGWDVESKVQLVSNHPSRCALVRTKRKLPRLEEELQNGLYLASLKAIEGRSHGPQPAAQSFLHYEGGWAIRRSRDYSFVFGLVRPLFYQEQ